uniref:Uncharacterized protein n=1 Tax=Siphoviridae sp. ctnpt50 TaxID=2827941 RepID=A0A8S5SED4_9CAUD|nr:MAG TPA: hypothetical protein [Siphoviridae sp. ctnpt50]
MALTFKSIYEKAINLFDDPIIQRAYVEDTVRWERMMYPHLENGVNQFSNPTKIAYLLVDQKLPAGQVEVFEGNGTAVYNTGVDFVPEADADFSFRIGTQYDRSATYENGVVTFSREVPVGSKCEVRWYSAGQFNTDFKEAASATTSASVIAYKVRDILARALVVSWATNEEDFVLDIRRNLNDTDFKLYSEANSIRSKVEWVNQLKFQLDTLTTKLAWDLVSRKYHGGNYYG